MDILKNTLRPFMSQILPEPQFMADNDLKHTSLHTKEWVECKDINWWKIPPESPHMNSIENFWHEVKEYQRRVVKPQTKQELIDSIKEFWATKDTAKCLKYINHLKNFFLK